MGNTIPEIFFETAKKFPQKTALLYKKEGVYFPVTYQELAGKILTLSSFLQSLGIEKGDTVAILSENRPDWVVSDMAIMVTGAVVVPLHTSFNAVTICKVLNHCAAKILIVSSGSLLDSVVLSSKKLKYLQHIIYVDPIKNIQKKISGKKCISWKKIFLSQKKPPAHHVVLHPNDCCNIIYTSGATGEPKGVMLSHQNFLSNIAAVRAYVPVKENDIFLSFLPLSHVLEKTGGYYLPLLFGATIAYAESTKQLSHNLQEVHPSILICVPRIFEKFHDAIWDKVNASSVFKKKLFYWGLRQKKGTFLYRIADVFIFKKIRQQLGGSLRLAISGGASLNPNLCKFFSKIGVVILEGYGLTETSPVISVNQEKHVKFGTVGKVIEGVQVTISEHKEILVKGQNVALGYFKSKKEWDATIDKNGWLHTGDLGFVDVQGFLTIIGRKKEMMVLSGGKNIWPEPIENLLNDDKYITQSMVVGNNQKFVSALLVPDWQEIEIFLQKSNMLLQHHEKLIKNPVIFSLFQQRLDEKINPKLSDVEKVKKFILLPQEFSQEQGELTPTLKLRRHIIANHYKKAIESAYE
jgi:long-chain acyl-CoA synthetase